MRLAPLTPIEFTAKQFLTRHELDRPDGRPLYAYRLTDESYSALRILISRWSRQLHFIKITSRPLGAVFSLFVAEWYRREFREGQWTWDGPCAAVGFPKDYQTLHSLTRTGLGYWQQDLLISIDKSQEYLYSLIVQGGIPTAFAARGDGWLSSYVRAVMSDLEAGVDVSPDSALRHAQFHDHRVPASFRVPGFIEIVGQLACHLVELRRRARAAAGQVDIVGWLDGAMPGWREGLPIAMADESAARLIEGLVRLRPDTAGGSPVTVERLLVRGGEGRGYRFAVRLQLDGHLDLAQLLPADAFADLRDRSRARLFPNGAAADHVAGCIAILEPAPSEEGTQRTDPRRPWGSRAVLNVARRTIAPFPLEADFEVRLHAENRDIATLVLPAGRRIVGSVLSYRATDDDPRPRELGLIGSGSVRTREPMLYFTVADSERAAITCETGDAILVERFEGMSLYRLTGRARVRTQDGDVYRLTTASEDDSAGRLEISGPEPDDMAAAVSLFCGLPAIRLVRPGGLMTSPPADGLRWRALGIGAAWQGLDRNHPPVGLIEIGLFEGDALQDRVRLAIIPAGARVRRSRPPRDAAAVTLEGFGDAVFEARPHDPQITVEQSRDAATDCVSFTARSEKPLPRTLTVELRRTGRAPFEVQIPLIGREVAFYAANGRRLKEREEIGLADLRGLTIEGSAPGRIHGEVHAVNSRGNILRLSRRFEKSVAAATLRAEIEALLAASDDLDAVLRLTASVGVTECRIDIRRFALALVPASGGLRAEPRSGRAWAGRSDDEGGPVTVVGRRFADLCGDEVVLATLAPDAFAQETISVSEFIGPGLFYARSCADGRVVSRPLFAVGGLSPVMEEAVTDRLMRAVLTPERSVREDAVRACVEDLGKGRYPDAAETVLRHVRTFSDVLPPQTFDLLRHVSADPSAMVEVLAHAQTDDVALLLALEDQLPFSWITSPLTSWMKAFDRRRKRDEAVWRLVNPDPTWGATYALNGVHALLDRITALAPALAIHADFAKLKLGVAHQMHAFETRLNPRMRGQGVKALASICIGRNRERDDWPRQARFRDHPAVVTVLPPELSEFDDIMMPMLDAPYVAAALAFERIGPNASLEKRLRVCRFYDPAYFDQAFSHAVGCLWAHVHAA